MARAIFGLLSARVTRSARLIRKGNSRLTSIHYTKIPERYFPILRCGEIITDERHPVIICPEFLALVLRVQRFLNTCIYAALSGTEEKPDISIKERIAVFNVEVA